MKKYFVEVFVTFNETESREFAHACYECESYSFAKNWTGDCIRLEDANSYEEGKRKPIRRQMKRGIYITINKMPHWKNFEVVVFENGTDNVVDKWEA